MNMLMEIEHELDRIGAPKFQPSGYSYSPIGRLRALVVGEAGDYCLANISKLQSENKILKEALEHIQRDLIKAIDVCEQALNGG